MEKHKTSVLILNGSVGVGKTTVAEAIADILSAHPIPNAVIDMDTFRNAHPRPKDDPFHKKLGYKNLASVWPNYKATGVTNVIISNVVEAPEEVDVIRSAIPNADVAVVLLTASIKTIHERLENREAGDDLRWHKDRAVELAGNLPGKGIEHFVVDTENKSPDEIAREIISALHWI